MSLESNIYILMQFLNYFHVSAGIMKFMGDYPMSPGQTEVDCALKILRVSVYSMIVVPALAKWDIHVHIQFSICLSFCPAISLSTLYLHPSN